MGTVPCHIMLAVYSATLLLLVLPANVGGICEFGELMLSEDMFVNEQIVLRPPAVTSYVRCCLQAVASR